eukprot:403351409
MEKVLDEIHLTSDSGVIKKILRFGSESDPTPEKNQEVTVNYEGRLEDGSIFDTSRDRGEALKFIIGSGQVIKGWDIGIISMKLGEKAELHIKPEYAYGRIGAPPKIPGDATLIFTVEVIQINDRKPTRWMMSDPELIKVALRFKDDGNLKFKAQKFKEAEGLYRDALAHLDTVKNDNKELRDLKKTILLNLSVVTNNTGDYKETLINCTKALDLDEKAGKAYFLRAQANLKLHQYDEAIVDIKEAIKITPSDKKLRDEFETIKAHKKKYLESQQKSLQSFFAQGLYNEKEAQVTKIEDRLPEYDQSNPQTYFDIEIGEEGQENHKKGRVVFELFKNKTPKTAENFRCLCTGEKEQNLHYKGNVFHRIIKGFMMQGGDITNQNGTGGKSIYGFKFPDEKIWLPHTHSGLLSMANSGPDTNGSQFFITFKSTKWLDNKHTVFGRVIHGMNICRDIEQIETGAQDKPLTTVKIVDCGELHGVEKLTNENADNLKIYTQSECEEETPINQRVIL